MKQVPTPWIFPAAAVVVVLIVIPVVLLRKVGGAQTLAPKPLETSL